jgi:hypothetical protein
MFNLFRKSPPQQPTSAIAKAMVSGGLPPGMDPSTLSVLQHRGSYSGRQVSYFRVFDPVRVAERSVKVVDYSDLDGHPELVLGSGHVEKNGAVVLTRQDYPQSTAASTFARSGADRADHRDDERFVFPDDDKAP